ncbi:uncharacterized protein AB675_7315 [Cyphellophora attinorum]|uniref:Uncharacterized protein n=1 Tax=Cyphellophora attinorum TaxID=1664694 RepID=A0A0N0NIV0_9EURO|nr:uncharacterized protein AB675_7315 [Phialophora attinorum]KPI36251.1 hypothetical protein AB675_7315 [Phialophora attinorum]
MSFAMYGSLVLLALLAFAEGTTADQHARMHRHRDLPASGNTLNCPVPSVTVTEFLQAAVVRSLVTSNTTIDPFHNGNFLTITNAPTTVEITSTITATDSAPASSTTTFSSALTQSMTQPTMTSSDKTNYGSSTYNTVSTTSAASTSGLPSATTSTQDDVSSSTIVSSSSVSSSAASIGTSTTSSITSTLSISISTTSAATSTTPTSTQISVGAFILQVGNLNPTWSSQYAALENVTNDFGDPIPVGYTSCPLNPQQFILQDNRLDLADGSLRLLSRYLNPSLPPFPAIAYRWEFWTSVDDANGYLINHNVTNAYYVETQCSATSDFKLSCTAFDVSGLEGIDGRLAPHIYVGTGSVGFMPMDLDIIYLSNDTSTTSFSTSTTSSSISTALSSISMTSTSSSTIPTRSSTVSTSVSTTSNGISTALACPLELPTAAVPGAFLLQVGNLTTAYTGEWVGAQQSESRNNETVLPYGYGYLATCELMSRYQLIPQQFILENNNLVAAAGVGTGYRLLSQWNDPVVRYDDNLFVWYFQSSVEVADAALPRHNAQDDQSYYVETQCHATDDLKLSCTAFNTTGFTARNDNVNNTRASISVLIIGSEDYDLFVPVDLNIIYLPY